VRRARTRNEQGFVTVWTVALTFSCVLLVGLAHDAGRALRARSDAFGTAAAAARAGAQQLDRAAAVTGTIELDPEAARSAAFSYLNERDVTGTVDVDDMRVSVTVTDTTDLQILPFPRRVSVDATATAEAVQGPITP
jgi:Putative Flp pilus-assembly TadE/G-like